MSIYMWPILRIQMSTNKWSSTFSLSSHFFLSKKSYRKRKLSQISFSDFRNWKWSPFRFSKVR